MNTDCAFCWAHRGGKEALRSQEKTRSRNELGVAQGERALLTEGNFEVHVDNVA